MATVPTLPITSCPDGAGSINTPGGPTTPVTPNPYVPPDLCIGTYDLNDPACADPANAYQEGLAAENLSISGAPVNVFKLLGVHEQGRLVDVTGKGQPLASSGSAADAFDGLAGPWVSDETGLQVTGTPAYLGYDFGTRKTSYGQEETAPGVADAQHITSIKLTQSGTASTRVRQVRVERSTGGYRVEPLQVLFTGTGNGTFSDFKAGYDSAPGLLMLSALSATTFSAIFIGDSGTSLLGVAAVGVQFNSPRGSFTVLPGSIPFVVGDSFTAPVTLDWYRVDVINVPDVPVATLSIKQSSASRYWRIVPLVFSGVLTGDPWVVEKLELFDYQATRLDNIQDQLLMENRDRDYANASIQLKASYTPFDPNSDLSKFGFQVADLYTFQTSFAQMVMKLGRPIVVGDILEVPSELQYDHNLRPVRKFLEVSDVGWAAEGYTTSWKPIIYRFQAQQLIPSQENRDILGTADTQKYVVDDGTFFAGIEQIQTGNLTATEANQAEALLVVPEKGTNVREQASGTNRFKAPGTYDGVGPYVEDGLPPDGLPYLEGFVLPDVSAASDGDYYRLNYPPQMNIAARLYKFSSVKNKWLFVETDRRTQRSAHKPSQLDILNLSDRRSLTTKL
jgi:hypothetical protein